jgi:hypothetical protein
MKKIILISLLISFITAMSGQNAAVDADLSYDATFVLLTGQASDTIGIQDSTWTFTVRKKTDAKMYHYYYISLDSVGGTTNIVDIIRQKKMFLAESYTNVDTVSWHGTADTTFSSLGSQTHGEYWRILIKGRDDTFKAKIIELDTKFLK